MISVAIDLFLYAANAKIPKVTANITVITISFMVLSGNSAHLIALVDALVLNTQFIIMRLSFLALSLLNPLNFPNS